MMVLAMMMVGLPLSRDLALAMALSMAPKSWPKRFKRREVRSCTLWKDLLVHCTQDRKDGFITVNGDGVPSDGLETKGVVLCGDNINGSFDLVNY